MKAKGKPTPEELALLEPFRAQLPPEVFDEPYHPPGTDGSGSDRRNLREAQKLLVEAGWKLDTSKGGEALVRNAKGETLDVEFLSYEPTFDRVIIPYIKNLQAIGINASIRKVDFLAIRAARQIIRFRYSVSGRFSMSMTPGIELKNFWSSETADSEAAAISPKSRTQSSMR